MKSEKGRERKRPIMERKRVREKYKRQLRIRVRTQRRQIERRVKYGKKDLVTVETKSKKTVERRTNGEVRNRDRLRE